MPADPFLVQSFWTYPDPPGVAPGQPLDFRVVIPPPVTGVFPLTGSVIKWSLQDVTTTPPRDLRPGVDYQILDGDLSSPLLSVVFAPLVNTVDAPVVREFSVQPEVTLFYWNTIPASRIIADTTNAADYPHFSPQTYTLEDLGAAGKDSVKQAIKQALCLVAERTVIDPGEPVLLNVLPRSVSNVPYVVTSTLDETPQVEIRAAVPLKPLVDAIIGPLTGALSKAVPGSRTSLESAGSDVTRLLGQPLAIPLAVDVLGRRVSKTLAPIGDPQVPVFTSTPSETRSLQGMVPIGRWQSPFTIRLVEEWSTEGETFKGWSISGATYKDLSPGVDLIKSFLLLPKLVPLSRGDAKSLPTPVTVTVTLHVDLEVEPAVEDQPPVLAQLGEIKLPPLTLQLVPLSIPRVATVFRHDFEGRHESPQWAWICPDLWTAEFLPSIDDGLRLFTRIGTVLNNVVAVAHLLAGVTSEERSDWDELIDLATAFSMLTDQLGRVAPENIRIVPAWKGYVFTDSTNRISAVIYVGLSGPVTCRIGKPVIEYVIDVDHDGAGTFAYIDDIDIDIEVDPFGEEYITIDRPCVLPSLRGRFDQLVQIPPGAARATNRELDYNDQQYVRFIGCPATELLGATVASGNLDAP